jgi:disulfide bond formation protein DsbB
MGMISLAACNGSTQSQAASSSTQEDNIASGQQLFVTNCGACHGPTGEGLPGLGKPLTTSEFVTGLSDEDLLAFINAGRLPDDPLNTTGVAMPPKGGNPSLTDEQLRDIIAYIRSIHKE